MADGPTPQECPGDQLESLLQKIQSNAAEGMASLENLVVDYPSDPRLLFLQGSLLAGEKRYGEAREIIARAVALAPGFAIARFQLGFLEFTSGEAAAAEATWKPLADLPQGNPLRLFSIGLNHFGRDDFAQAMALLKEGIARNTQNLPLNVDMNLLLEKARELLDGDGPPDAPSSAVQFLLQQYGGVRTKH